MWVIDRKFVSIVDNYLYIMQDQISSFLHDKCVYILAKNNATIGLLIEALNNVNNRVDN